MKKAITALFVLAVAGGFGCGADGLGGCATGDWRCRSGVSQLCGAYGWEDWQSCSAIGEVCVDGPSNCSGYDVSCCR